MVLNHVRHSFWRCCCCWYFKKIETDSLFLIALLYISSFAWMSPFDNKTSIFFIIFYFYPWSESYLHDPFINKFINKLKWINLFVCFLYVKSKAVTFRVLFSQFFTFSLHSRKLMKTLPFMPNESNSIESRNKFVAPINYRHFWLNMVLNTLLYS